jgi:S1-C subfamily serine protease
MTLSRADAIRITVALWLANQAIGYAVLGYPRTVDSVSWGLAIGAAAVLSTIVAQLIVSRLRTARGLTQAVMAFGGTFIAYETALYTVAVAGLGGTGSFAAPIVGRVLVINAAALAGLYALYLTGGVLGIRPAVVSEAPVRSISS